MAKGYISFNIYYRPVMLTTNAFDSRVEFTKEDDKNLVAYLAEQCPETKGRQGPGLYKRLTEDVSIRVYNPDRTVLNSLTRRRRRNGRGPSDTHYSLGSNGTGATQNVSIGQFMNTSKIWQRRMAPSRHLHLVKISLLPRANGFRSPKMMTRNSPNILR